MPAIPVTVRWSRRRLSMLALAALALVAVWLWLVPTVVAAQLLSRLRQAGFVVAELESVEVGLTAVTVHNLHLADAEPGTGHVTIGAVTMAFGLADLWHARIDTLVLHQPTWIPGSASAHRSSPFDDAIRAREGAPQVAAASQALPAIPVRLVDIRGGRIAPWSSHSGTAITVDGTLTVDAAQWTLDLDATFGTQLVQAQMRLANEGQRAVGTAALRLGRADAIDLEGECELRLQPDGRHLDMALRRRPGPFEVSLAGATWSGDGTLEVHATVPFSRPDQAALAVQLEGLDLATTNSVQLRGLSTRLDLRGLPLPVSTGPQQVRWQSLQLAKLRAGSGEAEVHLVTGPELRVQMRQRTLDEIGTIHVHEVRLAQGLSSHAITADFDQVPLQGCLELMSQGHVTGDGRLSGTLSMVVRTDPRLAVELQRGRLTAAPGGVVRFLDAAASESLVQQHIEQIAAATGHDTIVQDRLVAALQELVFTDLDFRIEPDPSGAGVTLQVHAVGEGRKVAQPIDLRVNLHDVDTAVDTVIALALGLEGVQERMRNQSQPSPANPPGPRNP